MCGFLKPSEAEKALGFVVTQMGYSHSPASGAEQESGTEELYCYMASESSDDPHVTMMYEPGGLINRVVYLGVGQVTVFDDAKTFENAEGFNIDGVEGEGLTLIEENRSIAMWHYPDDHVLIVQIGHAESDDAADQRPQAIALVEASVNGVVEQASKPLQEFTVYPPDSGVPGIEYATPNPG
ncbi:hypothetical protein MANAM107_05990 [Actinomyces capricornis]|uniref:Uncharacterized protein n=1 Tax=Actinomyces capricornis TaxID=2755559 RepID=A0ABM7U8J9_9ACTO|nr:hypothetical protein MANAM107_05990 [Actinomyces capricornis]